MKNLFKISLICGMFFLSFSGNANASVVVSSSSGNDGVSIPSGSYGGEQRLYFHSQDPSHSVKIKYRASWEFNLADALECHYDLLSYGDVYDPYSPPIVDYVSPVVAQTIKVIDCDGNNNQLGTVQTFTYTIDPALATVTATPSPSNSSTPSTTLVRLISAGAYDIRFNKITGSDINAVPPNPACRTESNNNPTGEIYNDTTKIGLTIPFTAIKAVGCFEGSQDNGNGPSAYFWQTPIALFKYNVGNDPAVPIITSDDDTITVGSSTNLKPVFPDGNGTIDHGVGVVVSGTSYSVTPQETTTYTLTITNTQGPKTATKTITVNPEVEPSISVSGNTTSNIVNSTITVPYLVTGKVGDEWTVKVYKDSELDESNLKDTHTVSLTQESQNIPYTLSDVDDGNYIFVSELLTYPFILYTTPDAYNPPVEHRFTQSVFLGQAINASPVSGYSPDCIEANGEYCLLEQLPGFPKKIDTHFSLGSYLNRLYQLGIALAGVLGVVMIVVSGVMYMTTDSFTGKSEGKKMLMNAIAGVILALLSWIILNTLNPKLLNFNLAVKDAKVAAGKWSDLVYFSAGDYQNITGEPLPTNAQVVAWAQAAAQAAQVDKCVPITLLAMENSSGNPAAVGRDENVTGTPSNKALINSDRLYNGTTKTVGSFIRNETVLDKTQDHLGLDWRFSQGIGLLQVTFFPASWSSSSSYTEHPPAYETRTTMPTQRYGHNPKDLIDAQTNLAVGIQIWKGFLSTCDGDIQGAFNAYNRGSGGCDSTGEEARYGLEAKAAYDACIANNN